MQYGVILHTEYILNTGAAYMHDAIYRTAYLIQTPISFYAGIQHVRVSVGRLILKPESEVTTLGQIES